MKDMNQTNLIEKRPYQMYITLQIHERIPSLCFTCPAETLTHGCHQGCQLLPEQCCRSAVLQLPTALSCLAMGPCPSPNAVHPQGGCHPAPDDPHQAGVLAPTPEAGIDPQDALRVRASVLCHAKQKQSGR